VDWDQHQAGRVAHSGSLPVSHSVTNRGPPWIATIRRSRSPVLMKPCGTPDGDTAHLCPLPFRSITHSLAPMLTPGPEFVTCAAQEPRQPLAVARELMLASWAAPIR
jgi:hypothetical protein